MADKRKRKCAHCAKSITGTYMIQKRKNYHPDCARKHLKGTYEMKNSPLNDLLRI